MNEESLKNASDTLNRLRSECEDKNQVKIELYKIIDPASTMTLPFLKNRLEYELYIPTEFVITKPQVVSPSQARVFSTNNYYLKEREKVVNYEELYKMNPDGFRGTAHYDEILLVEVWGDYGSDGHVEYKFFGWRFIPGSVFKHELKEVSCHHGCLPDCICCVGDDWYAKIRLDRENRSTK